MSFLGGPNRGPAAGGVNSERVEMAATELDTVTDFYNRLVQSCHAKCISSRYAEAELNKGESVCIDRCVAKFNAVQKKVGDKLQGRGAENAASGGPNPSAFGTL